MTRLPATLAAALAGLSVSVIALAQQPATQAIPEAAPGRPSVADAGDAASIADSWVVPPVVASGTRLTAPAGTRVRWSTEGAGLQGDVLFNDGDEPLSVTLTGVMTLPAGGSVVKRFAVQVLGGDARRLVSYTRAPTNAHDANQPIVAHSLHLALGQAGAAEAAPLNDDYGVLFPAGDYTGVDQVALRGIAQPSLFHFADGGLGVIATRVTMSGEADETQASSALIFKADPASPADFTELGLIDLGTDTGIVAPAAVWDSAAERYVVSWTDNAGTPRWATVADLSRTELVAAPFWPENGGRRSRIVSDGNVGDVREGRLTIPGAGPTGAPPGLVVSPATALALTNRFGRIVNTGAAVPPIAIKAGDVAPVRQAAVQLRYSDGSTATRKVDWNEADLRRLASASAGTHVIRGTVRQPSYPQIFAYNRADPNIYRYDQGGTVRYLFIATDDTGNNNVGSHHLPIRVADSIAALADANGGREREVDLLNRQTRGERTAEGRAIAGCYWAPELHEIGGRLSVLFAPCFNPDDDQSTQGGKWNTVQAHIMQLRSGGDPANPADWSQPAAVLRADGSPLGRPDQAGNISLDMSYFTAAGQSYYTWSQRYLPPTGELGDPLTWIARVASASPARLASDPQPIIAPNLSFEENLSEGAFALFHDGEVHLVYSGSSVSPTYVVGGVRAREGADLTDIASWRKWRAPLQKSAPMPPGVTDYLNHEQGPGHGSFTTDEDGNALYVYHTWGNDVGGDGRDTRLRRLHWAADGRPVLDMTAEEEVAPAHRAVTLQVTVRRSPR
ncbi:family 43 glycosylhydrolase [Croceibacterium ferulae]|uniref:family 43 glycosylhydrolase n=1 Tax=Croceibacterium ferulae TaxID=1854641 RepID=UPI000EB23693|nr:family 43 glycosylhydrolase [Croceibacterium ferulae]